jgi:hypothetical protein
VKKAVLRDAGYDDLRAWKTDEAAPAGAPGRRIYIGRNMAQYVPGATASKWGNPFPLKKHTLEESLQLYEQHVRNGPLWNELGELRGAAEIGCWCKPAPCHGDVLVKLLAERFGDVPSNGGARATVPKAPPTASVERSGDTSVSGVASHDAPVTAASAASEASETPPPPPPAGLPPAAPEKRKARRNRLQ